MEAEVQHGAVQPHAETQQSHTVGAMLAEQKPHHSGTEETPHRSESGKSNANKGSACLHALTLDRRDSHVEDGCEVLLLLLCPA